MTIRVLVCGGRDFADRKLLFSTLYAFCDERGLWSEPDEYGNRLPTGLHVVSGGANGADRLAVDWAVVNWVPFTEFKADWERHGKAAGPIRNQRMIDEGKPDVVIAFPGGRGTADMTTRAIIHGIRVIRVGQGQELADHE